MQSKRTRSSAHPRRRAIVAVQVAVLLIVMLGFAALTVDVGTLYNVRAELQRSADAAALAGASAYVGDSMMRVRMDPNDSESLADTLGYATDRTTRYSEFNKTLNEVTRIEQGDILTGWLDPSDTDGDILTNPASEACNAVSVTIRRRRHGGGVNSSVPYFFAPIFGKSEGASFASAVAVFDDRVSGFELSDGSGGMLPFSIHDDALDEELANRGDQYTYDHDVDGVATTPDGIREIRLYPYPLSGPGNEGSGNFGILNIGTGNQGLQALRDQITNGVTADDMEAEVGTSNLTFYDGNGNPVTYQITGSPGMKSGLAASIESIEGQIVGFFVHNNVAEQGANAVYTIVNIRFGRMMAVKLNGNPNDRYVYVQPITYTGGGVKIDSNAPSSGGLMGKVLLAR